MPISDAISAAGGGGFTLTEYRETKREVAEANNLSLGDNAANATLWVEVTASTVRRVSSLQFVVINAVGIGTQTVQIGIGAVGLEVVLKEYRVSNVGTPQDIYDEIDIAAATRVAVRVSVSDADGIADAELTNLSVKLNG